ncbi:uncharacterized protein [Argopecten irradians]|uniref:uncharacterized protein n=1 Tax=Argopecten irradians TaxID=31199 RepID=UPI0037216323
MPAALEALWRLSCIKLKDILRKKGESVTGNKAMLVARCYALDQCPVTVKISQSAEDNATIVNPFSLLDTSKDLTYTDLNATANDRQWQTDLRQLPPCNFHQLFEYLVTRTRKFGEGEMKGVCHKKMRSYQFFQEGHIRQYEIAKNLKNTWVKAKVIASMKHETYRVITVFENDGDIVYAACECPAGLGVNGAGKCNHIGGLLFAINHFHDQGLQNHPQKVSCTSKLNGWIVPRNLTVKPKPVKDIQIKKFKFGKTEKDRPNVTEFDPRAPQDRSVNNHAITNLFENLKEYAPKSAFFLYHNEPAVNDVEPAFLDTLDSVNIALNTSVVFSSFDNIIDHKENYPPFNLPLVEINTNISDDVVVDEHFLKDYVEPIIACEAISDQDISQIESETREQSNSQYWKKLHKYKMTSSNFGKFVKCGKNPDGILKSVLYGNPSSCAIKYGKDNESDAIAAYINHKHKDGCDVSVSGAGIMLSKDRPGFGASVDGFVYDPTAEYKHGGLECKCPFSKIGCTRDDACKDPTFYFKKSKNGEISLDIKHNYFVQVQGQMYVTGLK